MKEIKGGVCAAKGFKAGGVHCGIRKSRDKRDLALIFSEKKAACAAVYTTNLVKGAPLTVTRSILRMVMHRQSSATAEMQTLVTRTGSRSRKK